jgi:hypothetical protein
MPAGLSIEQIDGRIAQLENDIALLTESVGRLQADSASAIAEYAGQNSTLSTQLGEFEIAISKKIGELTELKLQRDKSRQDSLALVNAFRLKAPALNSEILRTEKAIMTQSAELAQISNRLETLKADNGAIAAQNIAALQAGAARDSSLLAMKKNELATLTEQRAKSRQDSLLVEKNRDVELGRFAAEGQQIDSMLEMIDAQMAFAAAKVKSARLDSISNRTREMQKVTAVNELLTQTSNRFNTLNVELKTLTAERLRLQQSTGSLQAKYNQGRASLAAALSSVDAQQKRRSRDKESLGMLREKIRLDGEIAKCHNQMDSLIMQGASKRSGKEMKKAQTDKENECNALSLKLDEYVRKGNVAQMEARLKAQTLFQKAAIVDSILRVVDSELLDLNSQKTQAENALGQYDRSNPLAGNPTIMRMVQLDTQIQSRSSVIQEMGMRRDSLENQLKLAEKNVKAVAAQSFLQIWAVDSSHRAQMQEIERVVAQKNRLRQDSLATAKIQAAVVSQAKSEVSQINLQVLACEREISALSTAIEKNRRGILDTQEKNRLTRSMAQQEKTRLDSIVSVKQQFVATLSTQADKARQDSVAAGRELQQMLTAAARAIGRTDSIGRMRDQERLWLTGQRDSVKQLINAAMRRQSDKLLLIGRDKSSRLGQISEKGDELATLKNSRQTLVSGLKRERAMIDSTINATERAINATAAQLEKTRNDSVATEAVRQQSTQRMKVALIAKDTTIQSLQRQVETLMGQLQQKRQDSSKIAAQALPSILPYRNKIRMYDSLIAAKEKEIAGLRTEQATARQDSVAERRRQTASLVVAQEDIARANNTVTQARNSVSALASEKQKTLAEGEAEQRRTTSMLDAIRKSVAEQSLMLMQKKKYAENLAVQRDEIAARIAAAEGQSAPRNRQGAKPAVVASVNPAEAALKNLEIIYTHLSENRFDEAMRLFKSENENLRQNLDADSYTALKTTIAQFAPASSR